MTSNAHSSPWVTHAMLAVVSRLTETCSFCKDDTESLWGFRDPDTKLWLLLRPKTTDDLSTPGSRLDSDKSRDDIGVQDHARHVRHVLSVAQVVGPGLPRQREFANNTHLRFLHTCAGFPTVTTWMKAMVAGYCVGWPGLTTSRVQKYLPDGEETTPGHQKLVRQALKAHGRVKTAIHRLPRVKTQRLRV